MTHYFSFVQNKLSSFLSPNHRTVRTLDDKNDICKKSSLDQFHSTIPFLSLSRENNNSLFLNIHELEKYSIYTII